MDAATEYYFAVGSLHCHLYGKSIDLNFANAQNREESWRAHAQELSLLPQHTNCQGPLVKPVLCPLTIQAESRFVHSSCFEIVTRLWGKNTFTAAELDAFLDCAEAIGPFLPEIQFKESPDRLDEGIDEPISTWTHTPVAQGTHTFDANLLETLDTEGLIAPCLANLGKHQIPPHLEQHISSGLYAKFRTIHTDPAVQFWMNVAQKLHTYRPFSQYPADQLGPKLAQALRNLRHGGRARFPTRLTLTW